MRLLGKGAFIRSRLDYCQVFESKVNARMTVYETKRTSAKRSSLGES